MKLCICNHVQPQQTLQYKQKEVKVLLLSFHMSLCILIVNFLKKFNLILELLFLQ